MPEAHGTDRVRGLADGRWMLITPASKGWQPRSLVRGSRSHPGTAVLWDGDCYEVISTESVGSEVRYVLAEWDPQQAIRQADSYNEETETARERAYIAAAGEVRTRRLLVVLMFFTGQLPNPVQEKWELRYAFPSTRATLSSAVPLAILGMTLTIFLIAMMFGAGMGLQLGLSRWVLFGPYLLVVSGIRISSAMSDRPMGTPAGTILWLLWIAFHRPTSPTSPTGPTIPPPSE